MKNAFQSARRDMLTKSLGIGGAMMTAGFPFAARSQPLSKYTMIMPFDLIIEFAPELNADVGGHFKAQGLDIDIINARGTSIALQQVLAKQATFTKLGGLDLMKAHALQQVPVVSFGTIQQAGLFSIISLKSAPIRTPADMRGKTIGVASIGGGTENLLDLMLNSAGISPNDVPRQAVGLSPGNMGLLKQGRIQAFFATLEVVVALRRAGEAIDVLNVDTFAPIVGGAYVASRAFLEQSPKAPVQFLRAIKASVNDILSANPNTILDRIEKKYEVAGEKDRAYRIEALQAVIALSMAQGKDNLLKNLPTLWKNGADLVTKSNIAKIPDATALYTNAFIDEVR
jgi:ABC-type nitrate/sulfonate/bicarbonate transport system substrate-binding protein